MKNEKTSEMTNPKKEENAELNVIRDGMESGASEMEGDTVEVLRRQLHEAETKALRYQADLDNFRRRNRRETDEQLKYASLPLLADFLEAVDNFQRAIDAASQEGHNARLMEGIQMVAAQFHSILAQHGCQPIESVGQPFDPNLHQAIQMVADKNLPANQIVKDLRPGFRLHERVIRPSQVVVSTGPSTT